MAKRKSFPLRINPRLYDVLKRWSDDELRSVNGQIEYLLLDTVKKAGRWRSKENAEDTERAKRPEAAKSRE